MAGMSTSGTAEAVHTPDQPSRHTTTDGVPGPLHVASGDQTRGRNRSAGPQIQGFWVRRTRCRTAYRCRPRGPLLLRFSLRRCGNEDHQRHDDAAYHEPAPTR